MVVLRKVLVAGGVLVGVFMIALIGLPFVVKGPVAERVRTEVEDGLDAEVDWTGVGLSFFKDFPKLTLRLDDLTVVGRAPFAGDTLLSMHRLGVALDARSLLGGLRGTKPFIVRSVRLDEPRVHVNVLADGSSNWDIMRGESVVDGPAGPSARSMSVALRSFVVRGGNLLLQNSQTGLYASLSGLRIDLEGDFSRDRFVLQTRAHADATTLQWAGLPYLEEVSLDFDADLDADMVNRRLSFVENQVRLNELVLNFSGSAAQVDDNIALDVTFAAPRTDFSQALSLVPVVYAHDFESLETSGTFSLQGRVNGEWGDDSFPAFSMSANAADGTFRYPDLPLPARDIALHLGLDNPGGDIDSTVVRLDGFRMRLGDDLIEGSLTMRTPVSDPDLDLSVKGVVDLANVGRTVKLEGVDELVGVVRADAAMRARLSDIDAGRYEQVAARGTVVMENVEVRSARIPHPIAVQEGTLRFTPQRAEVRSLQMRLGSSDIQATGSLDNVLAFVLRGEDLRGSANFTSQRIDLDEWRSEENFQLIPVPAGLDLTLEGNVTRLTFAALDMADARGSLHLKDSRLTLDDFTMRTLGGRVGVSGFYESLDLRRPTFRMSLALDSLDIPGAAAAVQTVRMLAPVSRFARGAFSAELDMAGALGEGMAPLLDALNGSGSVVTTALSLEGFPALERLSEALSLPRLARPALGAVRSYVEVRDGRLHVRPFQVGIEGFRMAVSGSNGVDQTLDYKLTLALPMSALGEGAGRAVQSLITKAGRTGVELGTADTVQVSIGLAGTVTDPAVQTDFQGMITSTGAQLRASVDNSVAQGVASVVERVDSTREEALQQARAAADSIVQRAERQAATIREEARGLADGIRAEANRRADQVLAEAKNPVARAAATTVADRIRREGEARAIALVDEADRRADTLVAEAQTRADALLKGGGGP